MGINVIPIALALSRQLGAEQLQALIRDLSHLRHGGCCLICGAAEVPIDRWGRRLSTTTEKAQALREHHTDECLVPLLERHIYTPRVRSNPPFASKDWVLGRREGERDWELHLLRTEEEIATRVRHHLGMYRTIFQPVQDEGRFLEGYRAGFDEAREVERLILANRAVRPTP